ncbi:hypothetical protein [Candidatus Spongiisocius sp.]|uniref:hypothetical protein n=1 Tax=Candidatus Spongiisocius sp. TaxID=3101273 RepID=UPI003B5C908B
MVGVGYPQKPVDYNDVIIDNDDHHGTYDHYDTAAAEHNTPHDTAHYAATAEHNTPHTATAHDHHAYDDRYDGAGGVV